VDYMEFKDELLRKFESKNEVCFIKEESLFVNYKNQSCSIEMTEVFEEVKKNGPIDIGETYESIMNVIKNNCNVSKVVDWESCFPVVRPFGFGTDQELFHKELFLDLEIYIAEDYNNGMIRFVRNDEIESEDVAVSKVFENLNKVDAFLKPLDSANGIYYSQPEDGFSAARFGTTQMQKQIIKTMGKNYLFLISDDAGFIVGRNTARNYQFLKHLTEEEDFEYRISKKIYKCSDGKRFDYTDKRDIFKIIK